MENQNSRLTEDKKQLLPTKTKIAAALLIIRGFIFIFLSLLFKLLNISVLDFSELNLYYAITFFDVIIMPFAIFILIRKKWAWIITMVFVIFTMVFVIFTILAAKVIFIGLITYLLTFLIIFLLLLIDRKNFFKIAK